MSDRITLVCTVPDKPVLVAVQAYSAGDEPLEFSDTTGTGFLTTERGTNLNIEA